MAKVVVTMKIMPEGPETDLKALEKIAIANIVAYTKNHETKTEIKPIGYGISALMIIFVMEEDRGSTEPLEEQLKKLPHVESIDVTDVRRAIG